MKKNVLILPLVLCLSVSCQAKESVSYSDQGQSNDSEEIQKSESFSSSEEKSTLVINYCYEDGTFLARETKSLEPNKPYSIPVNIEIPFMSPNVTTVEGIKKNEEECINVIYYYDEKEIADPKADASFSSFMANEEFGLSFTFYAKSLHANQSLFIGSDFEITSSYISYDRNVLYYYDSYIENNYDSNLYLRENEEAVYTFSFSSDKAVIYKNTHRVFTLFNNRTNGNKYPTYNTVYKGILSCVQKDGFCLGDAEIHNLIVSKDADYSKVISRTEPYIITELECVDENDNILELHTKAAKEPYSYSFIVSDLPNYKLSDESLLSGFATESKTIKAKQIYSGAIHSPNVSSIDRSNSTGWSDENLWLKYANDLKGDFTMKLSLENYGAISYTEKPNSGSEVCWRTVLPIVYDTETKDRWVTRFDWFGWMDDVNQDGKGIGTSANYNNIESYVFDYNTDIYPIYKEMDVDITYSRRGENLYFDSVIKPKRTPYLGQQYEYHCALYGVQSQSLSFALSAEDSIGIITSLQY